MVTTCQTNKQRYLDIQPKRCFIFIFITLIIVKLEIIAWIEPMFYFTTQINTSLSLKKHIGFMFYTYNVTDLHVVSCRVMCSQPTGGWRRYDMPYHSNKITTYLLDFTRGFVRVILYFPFP